MTRVFDRELGIFRDSRGGDRPIVPSSLDVCAPIELYGCFSLNDRTYATSFQMTSLPRF
jgi:hypothetical protein